MIAGVRRGASERAFFVLAALGLPGCDIGLVAVRFDCGPHEAPAGDGCQPVGVLPSACAVEPDGRGGCLMPIPEDCAGPAFPLQGCAAVSCLGRDPRDARFALLPRGAIETPIGPFDPSGWDALYVLEGSNGDGTIGAPYATVMEAVAAAMPPDGASTWIVVGDGTYPEAVVIDKAVVILGACSSTTFIHGTDEASAAVTFAPGIADVTGVGGVTVTGAGDGIAANGSEVGVSQVRVRETAGVGLRATAGASLLVWQSAIDTLRGAVVVESHLILEDDTVRSSGYAPGVAAISVRDGSASIARSAIDHVSGGVAIEGSRVDIIESLIRGPTSDGDGGRGIVAGSFSSGASELKLHRSIVERSRGAGVDVMDATVTIEDSVVRDTRGSTETAGCGGQGLRVTSSDNASGADVKRSLIEGSHGAGIHSHRSGLTLEGVLVRDTSPEVCSGGFGDGVAVYANVTTEVRGARIEGATRAALVSFASLIAMGDAALGCSGTLLAAEPWGARRAAVVDEGDVVCGCEGSWGRCSVEPFGLNPWVTAPP